VILHIVYIVAVVIALVLGAYGIDPRKKYINVVIDILTKVKEVTPDNVDKIIDMIIKGLQADLNLHSNNPQPFQSSVENFSRVQMLHTHIKL